jgi:hypothetical protein
MDGSSVGWPLGPANATPVAPEEELATPPVDEADDLGLPDPDASGDGVGLPPVAPAEPDDRAVLDGVALLGAVEKNQAPATIASAMSIAAASQSRAAAPAPSGRRRSPAPRPWTTPVLRLDPAGS